MHAHAPQPHAELHVCEPFTSQLRVEAGAHAPAGSVHADQADQDPSVLHLRVSLPQLPQVCVVAPLGQAHTPALHAPLAHLKPHVPQLSLSLVRSTQAPPHAL